MPVAFKKTEFTDTFLLTYIEDISAVVDMDIGFQCFSPLVNDLIHLELPCLWPAEAQYVVSFSPGF